MNGYIEIVESEDHEMYYVTQTATYAVTANIYITKKKHKEFGFKLHEPEKRTDLWHPMKRNV